MTIIRDLRNATSKSLASITFAIWFDICAIILDIV